MYDLRPSNGGTGPNRWHRINEPKNPSAPRQDPFHHIFPQREDLLYEFEMRGINVDDYTIQLPHQLHVEIHSGGPRGGKWNQTWREFFDLNPQADDVDVYKEDGRLIHEFDLPGAPIVPYPN